MTWDFSHATPAGTSQVGFSAVSGSTFHDSTALLRFLPQTEENPVIFPL